MMTIYEISARARIEGRRTVERARFGRPLHRAWSDLSEATRADEAELERASVDAVLDAVVEELAAYQKREQFVITHNEAAHIEATFRTTGSPHDGST